jgi:hypothetical protein
MLNIIDPLTNNTYSLLSKLGKETLKKYIMQFQNGGSMGETTRNIDFNQLKDYINNIVRTPYRREKYIDNRREKYIDNRREKYIDTLKYLYSKGLKIQLTTNIENVRLLPLEQRKLIKFMKVFIEHSTEEDESELSIEDEDEDDSEFTLEYNQGAWNFGVMTNENHTGQGIARLLHFILVTKFYEYYKYHASIIKIGIDMDASAGFWDYLNLKEGRYGIDTYRGESKVIKTGFEKQTTLYEQYKLAIGMS